MCEKGSDLYVCYIKNNYHKPTQVKSNYMQAMQQVLALVSDSFSALHVKLVCSQCNSLQSKSQRRDSEGESHWSKSAACAWNSVMCKI